MRADFSTQRRNGRPRAVELLVVAVGCAALFWSALAAIAASRDLQSARASVQQLGDRRRQDQQRLRQLEERRRARDNALARQAVQTMSAAPARVLAALEQIVPAAARMQTLTLTYGGDAVELDIGLVTRTPETYDEFVARVERSGRFEHISFGSERRTGEMKAKLRARYREEEGS